jgi:transposase
MNLTIEQRDRVRAILPHYPEKPVGRKRADILKVFEGILWVLESGARWEDIDKKRFASYQTCHRYFQEWVQSGVLERALSTLVQEAESDNLVKLHESFVDGSFVRAKKGALTLATATKARVVA